MATVSFNKKKESNETETVQPTEIVPADNTVVATGNKSLSESGVEGEILPGDLKFPRINLVQKLGPLSDAFDAGSIIFNRELTLCPKNGSVDMTVLRLKKQYQEVIPFDSEQHPRMFNTIAEVREVGGSVIRGEGTLFAEIAHIQVAIKKPENCSEELEGLFCEEFEGNQYALALWTLAKTAYTSAGKRIITTAANQLKSTGLLGGNWNVTVEIRSTEKYSWFVPIFKLVGIHKPEALDFFRSLLVR